MAFIQVPGVPPARGKTAYVSFSAEINGPTTESLIAMMANLASQGAAEVQLLLSTPGGQVMHGINLYNMLRSFPFKLVTHNVGNVNSIGNAIFLAGEERYACPHSTFMYHGVTTAFQPPVTELDAKRLRECLANIEADELRIGSIMEQRSKLTQPQIRAIFSEARTMDATEAVNAGVVHEIKDVKIPPGSPVVALVFQRQG